MDLDFVFKGKMDVMFRRDYVMLRNGELSCVTRKWLRICDCACAFIGHAKHYSQYPLPDGTATESCDD